MLVASSAFMLPGMHVCLLDTIDKGAIRDLLVGAQRLAAMCLTAYLDSMQYMHCRVRIT